MHIKVKWSIFALFRSKSHETSIQGLIEERWCHKFACTLGLTQIVHFCMCYIKFKVIFFIVLAKRQNVLYQSFCMSFLLGRMSSSKCWLTKLIRENLDLHSSLEFFNHSFGFLALMCHNQLLIIQTTTEAVPSSCQYNNADMHFIGCFVKKTSKLITHLRIEKKILLNGQTRQTKSSSRQFNSPGVQPLILSATHPQNSKKFPQLYQCHLF